MGRVTDESTRAALTALRADLEQALADYDAAARRVTTLRRAVEALALVVGEQELPAETGLRGDSVEALRAEGVYPSLKAAVAALVREQPGTWSAKRLIDEVNKRDWLDPAVQNVGHALRSAAGRLVAEGRLRKVAPGVYASIKSSGSRHPDPREGQ